jgi:hypothetical protein
MTINYDGRRFCPDNDEPSDQVAHYRQDGDLLWGEFAGGHARRGTLAGTCAPDGRLEFAYCIVQVDGEVISGRCTSIPRVLDDGLIQLDEVWERYGRHATVGVSRLREIR